MKRSLIFLLKIIIMIVLTGFLYKTNRSSFEHAFSLLSWNFLPFFLLSGLLFIGNIILLSFRQILLLKPIEIRISVRDMFRCSYGGMFANMFLPAGMGFDVLRVVHFRSRSSLSLVLGWIVTDKVIGLLGLLILSLLSVNIVLIFGAAKSTYVLVLDLVVIVLLSMVLFLILSPKGIAVVLAFLGKTRWLSDDSRISSFLESPKRYLAQRGCIMRAILISLSSGLAAIWGVSVLGYALGGMDMALATLLFSPVVMLSAIIPVSPGNLGWTEAVAAAVGYAFGNSGGLTVFLLWRIVTMVFSLGGLPVILSSRRVVRISQCAE
jgi:glycosyltransferase 2 family protein